ncbi:MAG: hypothetical protein JJE22_04820 [Bacteroidia bacterium]|nr:hypothetical protein [Bacteroidia bacterium]
MKHCPAEVYLLCLLHLIIGVTAFAGGGSLMWEPNGSLLGMNQSWLLHSPFTNYFIPGLFLFLFNGILPMLVFLGLIFQPDWDFFKLFNIYKTKHGAWTYSLFSGIIIIAWIILQQAMATYFWLQPLIAATGLLIVIITMMPAVKRHYTIK